VSEIKNSNGAETKPSSPGFYVPGNARRKLFMAFLGLLLFALGMEQLWTPLRLELFGLHSTAEATRVFKTREGLPDLIMTNDVQVEAAQEASDRSYFFWNEFSFQTALGHDVVVRCPIGSQLKPLYPLIDDEGLPTTVPVAYDPRHPQSVIFPTIFSTWFAPAVLIVMGLICTALGLGMAYWANKPIELPHIPTLAETQGPSAPGA
jgi:hypothetical protein